MGTGRREAAARSMSAPLERLERGARVIGTAFLFASFGLGAVVLGAGLIPLATAFMSRGQARDLRAQRMIHAAFAFYVRMGSVLGLLGLAESGTERLRAKGTLVVANHPSLLDVVYLISRMPQADCVVKAEALRNPALRWIVRMAGYIPNDQGKEVVHACAERLRAGRSVVLFPEGSRSPERGLGRFKRGAAYAALESGCPILPVVIQLEPPALKKGQPWYRLPNQRLKYSLIVGEPVHARDLVDEGLPRAIAARKINAHLRAYFEERLVHGAA